MNWIDQPLSQLASQPVGGYAPEAPPSSEPTALAALALAAHGRFEAARRAADWLARAQSPEGSVGIDADHGWPRWPTGPAVWAWAVLNAAEDRPNNGRVDRRSPPISQSPAAANKAALQHPGFSGSRGAVAAQSAQYAGPIERGADWILALKGRPLPRDKSILGHDTRLIAWPWVEGTHSWIEPTAMHVLALKAAGKAEHPRTREAVALLLDRQLKTGGCNYGNTVVLGQQLRPHVQPTALALLALAGEQDEDGRVATSLDYLERAVSAETTTASLGWALTALTAHGRRPEKADDWLQIAFGRTRRRGLGTHHLALLLLAAAQKPMNAER